MMDSTPSLFQRAAQLHNDGKRNEALRAYWQIYCKRPHPAAALRMIRIFGETMADVSAAVVLHMALKEFPGDFMLNHVLAMESQKCGDFDTYHRAVRNMASAAKKDNVDIQRPVFWPFIDSDNCFKGKYLFISGAARSGTTALGQLLNLSPEILLLVERYSGFYGYSKPLFDRTRLLLMEGHPHEKRNRELLERYEQVKFIGDKRPNFAFSIRATLDRFRPEELRIVHIIRNPLEVGLSFERRAANKRDKWPGDRGFQAAVDEINWNNREILETLQRDQWAKSIRIVEYGEFWSDALHAHALFEWLGLSFPAGAEPYVKAMFDEAKSIAKKHRPVSVEQRRMLEQYDKLTHERLLHYSATRDPSTKARARATVAR